MASEDEIGTPDEWRSVAHPRRKGLITSSQPRPTASACPGIPLVLALARRNWPLRRSGRSMAVAPSPLAAQPRMGWRDGEQEEWAYDWKEFLAEEMREHLPLAEAGQASAQSSISGPADIVPI